MTIVAGAHVLDNAAWASLTGPHHTRFVVRRGLAGRYDSEVTPFHAIADPADPRAWDDLATLAEPGTEVPIVNGGSTAIPGWEPAGAIDGVQMVDVALRAEHDPEAVRLTTADVPEVTALIELTKPGPWRPRTIELGTYLGIRRGGTLVAMAGERLHPPGWTEISAVCTHPAHRGDGLATRLVRAVAAGIRERGETPFLHASATNTRAIRLYEQIGFELRRKTRFGAYRRLAA